MNQQALFEPEPHTLARRENPETSHQAAARVREFAAQHREQIMKVLREHGELTVHEIAAYCRLDAHSIGKRMSELEAERRAEVVIVPDGDAPDGYTVKTRPSPSGRAARVWRAAK